EAMVSLELKKILAYSTMSQIGYMMLALGVAGMSAQATIASYAGGLFHLLSHALFKAALFLCAGAVIHATGSIYIHEKSIARRHMPFTWLFMWLAALSLAGIPPFLGFWSKDEILLACMGSGQYALFLAALLTAGITCFYTIRMMGYIFHSRSVESESENLHHESSLMWIPFGVLSALSLGIGLIGYWVAELLQELFEGYFTEALRIPLTSLVQISDPSIRILVAASSIVILLAGGVPAYMFYISRKVDSWSIVSRNPLLKVFHKIFWNRWYIDQFYNLAFVRTTHIARPWTQEYVENTIDSLLNVGCPKLFASACSVLRRLQTGILSINMLYVLIFMLSIILTVILVVI
ncbi:MAG: hypothetical protein J7K78_00245, partial [Thaumarchaeota archaeon]|nr:hypothetical protein [Nitrososphaerota archaeon]